MYVLAPSIINRLWDLETGKSTANIKCNSSVRTTNFSYSGTQAAYSTDSSNKQVCNLVIIDVRCVDASTSDADPILRIPFPQSRITSALWANLDQNIITGHENGTITLFDVRMAKEVNSIRDHTSNINDMQMSKDGTMFVTASKDNNAKLFDSDSLVCLKTYKTERPVNSAAISPLYDHVILGGGQDAMDVTTTSTRSGKFDSRFFHLVYEEEFGRVKGHFGPINSLAIHPDGRSYATGGEDGYIRVQTFDNAYHDQQILE